MARVIYLMNTSLDGFIEGPDGNFDWSMPDEEIHRFHNDAAREMSAFLYGRRIYQTMAVWQTYGDDPSLPSYVREFGEIWKSRPKFIFSRTLESVGPGCTLIRGDAGREVARLKRELEGDLGAAGPGLASSLAKLDLIDEYRVVVNPVILGGGKQYFPSLDGLVRLRLLETRRFGRGEVYLRYERVRG